MLNLTTTELFFYGGIVLMGAAAVLTLLAVGIFRVTGRRLRSRLEEEYGKKPR